MDIFGGEDDNEVTYTRSQEQKAMFRAIRPIINMMSQAAQKGTGVWPVMSPESMMPSQSW